MTGIKADRLPDLYGDAANQTYAGVSSFAKCPYSRDLAGVNVAVAGAPFDLGSSFRPGARFGPAAVRAASALMAWGPIWPWGFAPCDRLKVVDYGDFFFDYARPQSVADTIEACAQKILQANTHLLVLGGDHYVTLPLLRAHASKFGPLPLVHFDAHPDTWKDEADCIDHGTFLYHALQEGLVDARRTVQVGIRVHSDFKAPGTVLHMADLAQANSEDVAKRIFEVTGGGGYLTFDIDCLDPAFAPGTGTPVPGGMSTLQVLSILRAMKGFRIIGMDLVEICPPYDSSAITAIIGAQIAFEGLCLFAESNE